MDDLLSEFIAETRETLEALSGEVIAWEADPTDRARLDSIFRFVHTVKGSCGFLELPRFERLSHAAEDVLAELRAGTRQADPATVNAVLAILDRIGELTEALEAGQAPADGNDDHLIAALHSESVAPAAVSVALPVDPVPVVSAGAPAPRAATRSIRIPLDLLDRMMSGVSDMVLARNELARRLRDVPEPGIEGAFERLSACVAEMRDAITRTRMQRIDKLFSALPRMVRDLSAELGKSVDLLVDGSDVELDREMIELIRDPLTHIVRNAIDHGIERPDIRRAARKPETGRLSVAARQSGNQIVIEVIDDGRGIDEAKVVQRAIASGILRADAVDAMTSAERSALIFAPGLTTAEQLSAISGRGVGMDVVRANIERIGGVIDVENRPGNGVKLLIRVPLTLTIIAALTVTAGGQQFAIPRSAIDEICHDGGDAIRVDAVGGGAVATIRGRTLPLVNLEAALGLTAPTARGRTLIVLRAGSGATYALGVEIVHDHEELVIKPASPPVMATGLYAGMSLPDSGVPMLLLDVGGIASAAGVGIEPAVESVAVTPDAEAERVSTLLFRDMDGARRGLRLSLVERIEDAAMTGVSRSAGRLRIAIDGRLLPLIATAPLPDEGWLKIVRLSDGVADLAYAIEDVIDIVAMPALPDGATAADGFRGVALVDGVQIELIDPYHLFAGLLDAPVAPDGALCLLADRDDPWTREILRPLIEAAGYRTAFAGDAEAAAADVVITGRADRADPGTAAAPIVRLVADRAAAGTDDIYRYDRDALLAAIRHSVGGRG